jgi:EAL domain-containing protein (putative c-di-GMP-specific phosphodiesterase class I)
VTGLGRILLVDDELMIRRAWSRALEQAGYDVEVAPDGEAAIALANTAPDVIVSDIVLPGIDGIELLRRMRERHPDMPFILVTGEPSLPTALEAIERGAVRYFTKPVALAEVVEAIAGAMRQRKVAHEAHEALDARARIAREHAVLASHFDGALDTLWMAYQPIVRADRSVVGYEALLRSDEASLPHPGAVIDAAERLERLAELGRKVRDRVAADLVRAPDGALAFVNIHPHDLLDESLLSSSAPLAAIAPRVVLEITERASLDKIGDLRERVRALRAIGYRVAIDDLGAGYAGLASFAAVEPEFVKIDMALVRGIEGDKVKQKIVEQLTALSHDLGLLVVAEGVETPAERDTLLGFRCDYLQGYLFGKPARSFALAA